MPGETYMPLIRWRCEKCGAAGEVALPPGEYSCDLAFRAHALECATCYEECGDSGMVVGEDRN